MSKSTAAQALASLQFKFQNKIREVGTLRAQVRALTANSTTPDEDAARALYEQSRSGKQALAKQAQTIVRERDDLLVLSAGQRARIHSLTAGIQHERDIGASYEIALQNERARTADLKSSVSNWKSFSGITFALGLGVGVLAALAYIAQTTPL